MEVETKTEENDFFIVKVALGKEDKVMMNLSKIIKKKELTDNFFSIFKPDRVDGYLFVECLEDEINITRLKDILREIPNTRGIIKNPLKFVGISKYFKKESQVIEVNEKDIVEMIAGPFKGERARVVRINLSKDEVIIEPLNMPVAVPITLSMEDIRVIKEEV